MSSAPQPLEPPGPRLPALIQGIWLYLNPPGFFGWVARKYGKVAHVHVFGLGHVVTVEDPELIKQVYLNHEQAYAGQASKVMEPVLGPHSVLLLDGPEHMRQRKLLLPPFHGDALRSYEERIREITQREIAQWPSGETFAMRPRMQDITLQVILQVIFGIDDQARRDRYSRAVDRLMAVANLIGLDLRGMSADRRFSPAAIVARRGKEVDELIYEDLAERHANPDDDTDDVLSLLLAARDEDGNAMSDAELRDELVTLLFAGHETTATALAWAIDLLAWNPAVLERATRAAHEGDTAYLDALAMETLRMRPVVWSTGRVAQQPLQLGKWQLRKGTRIWSPLTVLGFDRSVYDQPERFMPERFIDAPPPPYVWIPFGGGIRRCIGASFAALEMRIVLEEILLSGRIETAGRKPERQVMRNVTLAPARGTRVRFFPVPRTARPEPESEPRAEVGAAADHG